MDNNNKFAENLLKADGIDPTNITESERASFKKMLDAEQKRMKRLSWLSVGTLWIFVIALIGLCISESLLEKLRIPFAVPVIALATTMVIVMMKCLPAHNRKLEEANKKVSKLHYLVHGSHRGFALISRKGNQRIIHWPSLLILTVVLWLGMSLAGAGVYYIMCQRWIYASPSEVMWIHVFLSTVMPLSFLVGILRQGLKAPLEELVEIKSKPSKPDHRPNIWRIIMHSKMTKPIAAAIIIVVLIGIYQMTGSIDGASVAFANVRAKVNEAGWMHLKGSSIDLDGEKVESEVWLSTKKQIMATKKIDLSRVAWLDYANGQIQAYEASPNELTLMSSSRKVVRREDSNGIGMWNYLNLLFGSEMLAEADIEEYIEEIDGVAFQVYELSLSEDSDKCNIKIMTDIQTNLPVSIVLRTEKSAGEIGRAEFECEYTDAGPESIYTLGVPLDAKVINLLPNVAMNELAEISSKKRERFSPYVFVCVEPSQGFLYINHIKGDTCDAAKHFKYVHYSYWIPNNDNICEEIEGRVFDYAESLLSRSDARLISASIWDGKKEHDFDKVESIDGIKWSVSKSRSPGNVRSVNFFWQIGMTGKIIEDNYSKSNNLIAVKSGRVLIHVDPLHDYVCVRYETTIENGKILLRELSDLVQTKEGYWYPRSETGTVISFDDDGNETSREVTFVHKYYIEKIADCPEDHFDVDKNVSKILELRNK